MEIAIILRTGRADFPYNVQVWTEIIEDGLTVHKYAGRGKFCADLEAAYDYIENAAGWRDNPGKVEK